MKILIVEDDQTLAQGFKLNLDLEGFETNWKETLGEAVSAFLEYTPDLVMLDLNLPDGHGFDFIKEVRNQGKNTPIIVLTAQTDEDSVIRGLELGANDYLFKPSSQKVLLARIKAHLKLFSKSTTNDLKVGRLEINFEKRLVSYNNKVIKLSPVEFTILSTMGKRLGCVFSREKLLEVANCGEDSSDRTIDTHLSNIRRKLKKNTVEDVKIESEYGIGYRLTRINT